MFYLTEMLRVVRDHKALALANFLLLAVCAVSLQSRPQIKNFFSLDAKAGNAPYFNALVPAGANPDYIVRKMRNLPGVAKVNLTRSGKLENEIKGFLSEIGESTSAFTGAFNAFKITLEDNTRAESRNLIKEYFSRLVGRKDISFTKVKSPAPAFLKNSPLYNAFSKWADIYIVALAGLGWFFTCWLLSQPLGSQGYVIERFQRKKKTALKMYLWLWGAPLIALLAGAVYMERSLDLLGLGALGLLLFAGSVFFIGKGRTPQRFI